MGTGMGNNGLTMNLGMSDYESYNWQQPSATRWLMANTVYDQMGGPPVQGTKRTSYGNDGDEEERGDTARSRKKSRRR